MLPLEQLNGPLHGYVLIDYTKPRKRWKPRSHHQLTEREAWHKNQGYAMNGTTLRLVREDRYWEVDSPQEE